MSSLIANNQVFLRTGNDKCTYGISGTGMQQIVRIILAFSYVLRMVCVLIPFYWVQQIVLITLTQFCTQVI